MKTSNKFTLVRIIYAPIFFILYFLPKWIPTENGSILNIATVCIMFPLLAFAEYTDYLDGHFARKHNEVSDFGKLFDPFADVILHLTLLACLMIDKYMPAILFMLIFYREFGMNFVRMVAAKQGIAIAARKGGKFKTVSYIVSALYCLFLESIQRIGLVASENLTNFRCIGIVLFCICTVAAYVSFIDYLRTFGSALKGNK
ncbi:MAG: CDP-diacylglycerol--glycerol-3-phosphate 3-phosphatidyltransferase [Treponema sp.]|nr:CDP-diacylglycerol--glycerol-3-phosphate 3-phosphatidyltransferase [Treponema sp.]